MVWYEIGFGTVLVGVLLALTYYFSRQQLQSLRRLRQSPDLPDEEMRYERRKAYCRLISSALTFVLAILLVVLLVYALPMQQIADQRDALEEGVELIIPDDDIPLIKFWSWTLITFLLVLLVVLILAGIDLLSTRRFALRQFRKLQADRRAMIQRQVNRMRRERNGHE